MVMRFLSVLALSMLVAACGFKLRGQLPIPEGLEVMSVQSNDQLLRRNVTEGLEFAGVTVVENSADALAVLNMHNVKYDRQVRTIDDRGKVTGYLLVYTVNYKVTSVEGENLRESSVSVRRDFNFDPDQVLQKEREEETLRDDMARSLTQQILRQLSTIAAVSLPISVASNQSLYPSSGRFAG